MATETSSGDVPLPKSWPANVESAVLQVISPAHLAITYSRSWTTNSVNARARLQVALGAYSDKPACSEAPGVPGLTFR